VRYRYRKFFLSKGITIQATPNFAKLGITRLIILAKLAPELENQAVTIFTFMNEACYLRSFTRVLPSHEYIIHVAVPKSLKNQCGDVFRRFHDAGLFTELKILEFEEVRNPPMKAALYNFGNERWSFQWPRVDGPWPLFPQRRLEEVERYDKFDLLIIKELEIDASRSLVQMAKGISVSLGTLQFHYLRHVEGRNLIRAYRVIWPGSRYDFESGKPITRKDRYIEVTVILEGGTALENAELRGLLNNVPFLWNEVAGPNYCAELFLPNDMFTGFWDYLEDFTRRVGEKLKVFLMDQDRALRFTLPYNLFDNDTKTWRLDQESIDRIIDSVVISKSPSRTR